MSLLKYFALPPGIQVLMLLVGVLLWMFGRRGSGTCMVLLAAVSLWILGLPLVSHQLQRSLEIYPAVSLDSLDADAIVVLGGGRAFDGAEFGWLDAPSEQTLSRLNYAAFLHRQTGLPVLVSGGRVHNEAQSEAELMQQVLQASFALQATWVEDRSRTTYENAFYSARMLQADGVQRVLLISQAWHLRRAVPVFEQQGLEVIAAPIQFSTPPPEGWVRWIPTAYYYRQSAQGLHEWLGHGVYQLRAALN
ncbi:putative membrane protein [Nitrincola lacisaponensis]|uniref:Putative membrane protein n=1 Tax=Nitrincola lacisaponensis TaxID=267850 RepID=A0A063XYU4_9GAMM|nr:YdcF family protein [Nitrincola lacisaponensis]KDE39303.1 putative membrane protein [Nitrincola lacisaponensis]